MTSPLKRNEEYVILLELLSLLLAIAVLRMVLAPWSKGLTSVVVLWTILLATSYLVGEFETPVRINFGLTLRTQAAFALAYVVYSGIHGVWSWCEGMQVRFWLALWVFLSLLAPVFGLFFRRLLRQKALFVTDTHREEVNLLRWWGFECVESIGPTQLAGWLKANSDRYGYVEKYGVVVVDATDFRAEHQVADVAKDYFVDYVAVTSFTLSGYLIGPHPRHIALYEMHSVTKRMKRLIDLFCSGVAIVLLGPLFIIVSILIKLDSPGSVFYRHRRLGRNMREFMLLKFRTMYRDADQRLEALLASDPRLKREFEATFKLKNDPRITRVGRVLRRLSIDELPQFFNIIGGQMSLVGPRPIVEDEIKYYHGYSLEMFRVLPGATGLWQVSGRSDSSYETRVKMDTRYVQEWTLWWDLKIIFRTVPAVLMRRGAY